MAAFVPMAWLVAGVAVVALALARRTESRRRSLLRAAVPVLVPPLLLLPWLPALVAEPQLLLLEAGLPGPGLSEPDLDGLDLLLLHPGGPGLPPLVARAPAWSSPRWPRCSGRPAPGRCCSAGWSRCSGLAGALALSRTTVTAPTLETPGAGLAGACWCWSPAPGWSSAAVAGAAGARGRVAGRELRLAAAGCAARPGAGGRRRRCSPPAGGSVTGAGDPLERRDPVLLPAFVAAEGASRPGRGPWCCASATDGPLSYALLRSDGPRTGDAELDPAAGRTPAWTPRSPT